ncbi:MAG: hypothetical protein LPJ91_00550 [Pseudazoarcus pumilus]|nr:hypothetical protein [Pseudazoarcus pumilus]
MGFKLFAGLLGLASLTAFLLPPLFKIKEVAMGAVVLIGIGMAAYEFYESMRSKED